MMFDAFKDAGWSFTDLCGITVEMTFTYLMQIYMYYCMYKIPAEIEIFRVAEKNCCGKIESSSRCCYNVLLVMVMFSFRFVQYNNQISAVCLQYNLFIFSHFSPMFCYIFTANFMNIFETVQNTVPFMPEFNNPMCVILMTISFFYLGYSPVSATMNILTLNCIESVDHKVRQWTKVRYKYFFNYLIK